MGAISMPVTDSASSEPTAIILIFDPRGIPEGITSMRLILINYFAISSRQVFTLLFIKTQQSNKQEG